MREPISLKEILAVIVKGGRGILLTALVLAIVLGGYQGKKQLDLSRLPENAPEYIESVYQSELAAYQNQVDGLEAQRKASEEKLEGYLNYMEGCLLMGINPNYVYQNVTVYALSDLAFDEGDSDLDSVQYKRTLTDLTLLYKTYWDLADTGSALQEQSLKNVDQRYIRELVVFETMDTGAVIVTTRGKDQITVDSLMTMMNTILQGIQKETGEKFCAHRLTQISSKTTVGYVEDVAIVQVQYLDTENAMREEIVQLQRQIDELPVPQKDAIYHNQPSVTTMVKWLVIGGVLGVILSCGWILVLFLFRAKVESSRQMEYVLGIPFLGSSAGVGSIWKRLADRMLNERVWKDSAQAQAYMAESIRAAAGVQEQVVILTSLSGEKIDLSMVEKATAAAVGKVICIRDAERNPETVKALRETNCVVLAERVGVSEVPKMLSLLEQAKRMDAAVAGFVTI